jgi:hypothetical protein
MLHHKLRALRSFALPSGFPAALLVALLPAFALAQHFALAYVDIRLVKPDSVRVTIEADAQDMMNTVHTFPLYADTGIEAYRLYELRLEQYVQQKVKLRADGKSLYMNAVAWKQGGKNRNDGLDSVSIQEGNHAITLGGRIPAGTKRISVRSDLWDSRPELDHPPIMEYFLFEGEAPRRRVTAPTGNWIHFPVTADSLAKMSLHPPRLPPRDSDHSGHNH